MHRYFADWYRPFDLYNSSEQRQKRWAGVEGARASLKDADDTVLLPIVRLVFDTPDRNSAERQKTIETLSDEFRKADDGFPMLDNREEVRALAGIMLTVLLENSTGSEITDIVALASYCASRAGHSPIIPNLMSVVEDYLVKESRRVRALKADKAVQLNAPTLKLGDSLSVLKKAVTDGAPPEKEMLDCITKIQGALNKVVEDTNTANQSLVANQNILSEENSILWWLFRATSQQYDSMKSMPVASLTLFAARELADLTLFVPGVEAVKSYLSYALDGRTEEVSLIEGVNGVPIEWRKKWFEQYEDAFVVSRGVCPVLSACYWSTITPDAWSGVWSNMMGTANDLLMPAPELGALLYNEAMLLRACE